ncbi:DUF4383 domain-containing protein [Candidatus Woesearchaeota archaeon]|nr:DUF4383 domain-containing protein [Candidatus Woesearchaeota archaeon]
MQKLYAMVIGAVLVLLGLVGFVQAPILGIFGVNPAQNVLHLVGGAVMLWFGYKGSGKTANMVLGVVAAVVGVLGLVPVVKELLASLFAINMAITWLHLAVAVVSLGVAYGVKEGA